ncbi:hypothetical protein D3C87_1825830 [compost metagenome]
MHLFRHVRRGVVDDDGLLFNRSNAKLWRIQHLIDLLRNPFAIQEDINKAGAGDFYFAGDVAEIKQLYHFFRQLAWWHAEFLGYGHHAVGLIVAELCFC